MAARPLRLLLSMIVKPARAATASTTAIASRGLRPAAAPQKASESTVAGELVRVPDGAEGALGGVHPPPDRVVPDRLDERVCGGARQARHACPEEPGGASPPGQGKRAQEERHAGELGEVPLPVLVVAKEAPPAVLAEYQREGEPGGPAEES
jgi:hypothetical protein